MKILKLFAWIIFIIFIWCLVRRKGECLQTGIDFLKEKMNTFYDNSSNKDNTRKEENTNKATSGEITEIIKSDEEIIKTIKNKKYIIWGKEVTITGGINEKEKTQILKTIIADINDNGLKDVISIIQKESEFYILIEPDEKTILLNTLLPIDKKIAITSFEVKNNEILVEYLHDLQGQKKKKVFNLEENTVKQKNI